MREFEPWIFPSHTWHGWPSGSTGWLSSPIETPAEPSARLRADTKRQPENGTNRWLAVTQLWTAAEIWMVQCFQVKEQPTWSITEEAVLRWITGQHPFEPIPWETMAGATAVVMISTSSNFSPERNTNIIYIYTLYISTTLNIYFIQKPHCSNVQLSPFITIIFWWKENQHWQNGLKYSKNVMRCLAEPIFYSWLNLSSIIFHSGHDGLKP